MPTIDYANIGVVINRQFITGVITEFDHEEQTATVRTISPAVVDDPLIPEEDREYTPVIKKEYSGVKFFYHCKGDSALREEGSIEGGITGFAIGDEVVMEGHLSEGSPLSTDFTDLKIISHTDEPRKCKRIRIYQTYIEGGNWYVGVYEKIDDAVVKISVIDPKSDFNDRYDIQANKPIYIVNAHLDTNKLFLIIHYKTMIEGLYYYWPLLVQYSIRWIYGFDSIYYCPQQQWSLSTDQPFAFNSGEPWNNGMMAGGYKVVTASPSSGISTTGNTDSQQRQIQEMWAKNDKRTVESGYEGREGTKWLPWLVGTGTFATVNSYNEFEWPCFQAQDRLWIDDNNDADMQRIEHKPHAVTNTSDVLLYGAHDTLAFWTEFDPPDYYQRYVQIRGIGFIDNRMILGVLICYDDENTPGSQIAPDYYPTKCDPCQDKFIVECYIAIFEGPTYTYPSPFLFEEPELIRWQTPAFLDFKQTELMTFSSIAEFERINQILGYDGRIFISFRFPAEIKLYDDVGNLLSSIALTGNNLCNMAVVESAVNGKPCLSCQVFGGPMVFYDIDTLEEVETFDIPDVFTPPGLLEYHGEFYDERQSSLTVNVPILPKAVLYLEVYRYNTNSNTDEMKIINHSPLACKVAQEHANWCVENAQCTGVGKDDLNPYDRMKDAGFLFVSENIALNWSGNPVVYVIADWKTDSISDANLLYLTNEGVGWGVATYPESCTKITIGVTETFIPEQYRGRIKIYVMNSFVF